MKTNILFLVFSFAALTLVSCGNEVDDVLGVQDEQIGSKDSIFTYDMYFDSEITPYDGTTRATIASDWEDGDVVYLHFGGTNDAYGKAVYISASKKWRVTCDKALKDVTNANCAAWFGKGDSLVSTSDYIIYNYVTEAFWTNGGKYTYSNNGIYVNANMKPQGWRLRFKGAIGTKILVHNSLGFEHYYRMEVDHGFLKDVGSFSLTVGNNGYTDYFAGYALSSCAKITIMNERTGDSFSHYFDNYTLEWGESGCFTIPTTTDLHGWTLLNAINGHTYVDLGLPSGTKWASCNIGAASIYESGGYYAWGETKEKNNYDWSNYTHCNGSYGSCYNIGEDIAGTEYDVAYNLWGGTWRMPSIDQFKELEQSCTKEWTKINGMNGCLITGPNGASIFLPAAGVKSYDQLVSFDQSCDYWSSSQSPDIKEYSKLLHISNTNSWTYETYSRFTGIPVRPICQ